MRGECLFKPHDDQAGIRGTLKKFGYIHGRTDGVIMPQLPLFGWHMCTGVMVVLDDDETAADISVQSASS